MFSAVTLAGEVGAARSFGFAGCVVTNTGSLIGERLPSLSRVSRSRPIDPPWWHKRVAVGELTSPMTTQEAASLYRKNLQAVTYVTGDLAGKHVSPAYAILQMTRRSSG